MASSHPVSAFTRKSNKSSDQDLPAVAPKTTATPPNPPSPYTVSLLDNIRRLKLDTQRIVPIHYPTDNRVVTMDELTKWIARPATH